MNYISISKKKLKRLWKRSGALLSTLENTEVDACNGLINDFFGSREMTPVFNYYKKVYKDSLTSTATILLYGCGCFVLSKGAGQILQDNKKLSKDDKAYLKDYIELNIRKFRIDLSLFYYLEYGERLW